MEVYHPMLSNTLDMPEVFNLMLLIHMLLKPTHVFIDRKSQLAMLDTEVTTLLKVMKPNLLKDFTMLVLLQYHSKSSLDSKTMLEVFIQSPTVEKLHKMLITQFWQLDMELKKESNSGTLKIHGVQAGVLKDISKLKEEPICVLLLNAIHILLLIGQEILKLPLKLDYKINH